MIQSIEQKNDAKKIFRKKGACSHTFFYLLNREFDETRELEERASDALAGGILSKGHQCGMLWGSAMAVGAEAYRRSEDSSQAIALAISATRDFMDSFVDRTRTVNCREITETDFSKKWQMLKYMVFKARRCFHLAEAWAPDAVRAAKDGLSRPDSELPDQALSCASELAKRMGASEEQIHMVAGFAGGMGLGGHACGALGAAIWLKSIDWCVDNPEKSSFNNPKAKNCLQAFYAHTNGEIMCPVISGRRFKTIDEHTEFIRQGGCEELIDMLVTS